MTRQYVENPIVDLIGDLRDHTLSFRRLQLEHLNGVARTAQDTAVRDDVALDIEEPRPRPRRLDEATHHLSGEIGEQNLPLIHRVEDGTLAERGSKNLTLGFQGLDLLPDQARLVFPEIKKATCEKRQRQHIDREDPTRER